MRYFKPEEFACKCGCGDMDMDADFLRKIDSLRHLCGFPFTITSGKRCPEHNAKIRGARNSQHLYGKAADISLRGEQAHKVVQAAREIGFNGIGVAQKGNGRFIHVDNRDGSFAFWSY